MTPSDICLTKFYNLNYVRLVAALRRRFPATSLGAVEDAVGDAFCVVLEDRARTTHVLSTDGSRGLFNLLYVIAWRGLRAECRRPHRVGGEIDDTMCLRADPETVAANRELVGVVRQLLPQAARGFGRRKVDALERALCDRLQGESDSGVARRHDVPREYVNRAKRWLCGELLRAAS